MVEEGGTLLTDFELAPHSAKDKVLSEADTIPGSKVVKSAGCNFHFCSGLMKDSKLVFIVSFKTSSRCIFIATVVTFEFFPYLAATWI